jgi:hypothetical protein
MIGYLNKTRMRRTMRAITGGTLDHAGEFLYWCGWRLVWAGLGLSNLAKKSSRNDKLALDSKAL